MVEQHYTTSAPDLLWQDPPVHTMKRVGKTEQTRLWAEEARRKLRRRPHQWALLRSYRSPARAWGAKVMFEERGLFEGCELHPTKSPDHGGSELYGRFTNGQA